jgi:short-subunit dehydrogenase
MTAHDRSPGVVVITGTTGMLGSATATQLARRRTDRVIVARDAALLGNDIADTIGGTR